MTLADHVDVTQYTFTQQCALDCGRPATVFAKGCMDKKAVPMCDTCLKRGLDVVSMYIRLWQRTNKKVMICGDCYRPILTLETHLEITRCEDQLRDT